MRTKIVYVLVSQESDYYYEMFLLSHYSLRLHHPKGDAEVVLVMDTDTHQRLVDKKASVLDDVTPVVVSIPEEYNVMQRSRYIKTSLRQRVEGDFLFIDSDTIICEKLNEIDRKKSHIAALPESVSHGWEKQFRSIGLEAMSQKPFYNSGVILVKDCSQAMGLFKEWHKQWKISAQQGINYDQPSLCLANALSNSPIEELPVEWNYSLERASTDTYPKAKVFHYFNYTQGMFRIMLMKRIRDFGTDGPVIKSIAQKPLSIGRAAFIINDTNAYAYIYSDMLHVFETNPPLFKFCIRLSKLMMKPIKLLSKIKRLLCSHIKSIYYGKYIYLVR